MLLQYDARCCDEVFDEAECPMHHAIHMGLDVVVEVMLSRVVYTRLCEKMTVCCVRCDADVSVDRRGYIAAASLAV